ncbi:F-box and WD repeat domain containing protein 10B isoform X3 [Ochotona princeps]|uniref:F-box and WD repeat domain containing protein 10B isoform X3 n=1 Tax=Ochotona princeps TaxID=9978 RepID=UPI00271527F0|nr:F-box and WD repeat domain containing protein 10B isoform X3 [Ochotona princeps]
MSSWGYLSIVPVPVSGGAADGQKGKMSCWAQDHENLESRFKNAPYFRCEKGNESVPVCQKCETCVLAWKIFSTKEWFQRINEMSQRRFLVSMLQQLNNLHLLHYFQTLLQGTQGKDFIYHRARVSRSRKEAKVVRSSLKQVLDRSVEHKMKAILYWFGSSTNRTKANFLLLLLQVCNYRLLITAADVIQVLFVREWNRVSGSTQDSADVSFTPEQDSSKSATSRFLWAARSRPVSFPLSKASVSQQIQVEGADFKAPDAQGPWKSSLQCISEMNRLFAGRAPAAKPGFDPCHLLLSLEEIRDLSSGCSKYRDFIRYLPIHLSKRILRMLDKNTLNKCASVSQHWAAMAQQVRMDLVTHTFIQNQITLLQGSFMRGVDPNYANKLSIPVPKMAEDGKRTRVKNPKLKLRTKNDYNLWTAYQNQETQQIQMEERNVFCGSYNIRILFDTWDQNRVIHYSGGNLVAVSSNRKIHLLDLVQVKVLPTEFRGHAGSIRSLFLCEEENFLLSGSYDLSIRYWDLKSGACLRIFNGHQGTVTCMDLLKNRLVSGAKDGQVKEWDIDTGKCLKTYKHKDPILAIRINDTYIVSSCERGLVKVWHMATAQLVKTLMGHEGAVKCLFFDQWHIVSGGSDGLVMAWSMVGKYERCLMAFKHPKEVLHVALLYLRVISACADGKIRIYNFLNGNCLKVIKANGRGDPVLSFFFQGNRMLINTESNIVMFQFEPVKWQYSADRGRSKRDKDREEEKEDDGFTEVLSKTSAQAYSPRDSPSSKQTVAPESLLGKPPKSRVLGKAAKLTSAEERQRKLKSPRKDAKKRAHPVAKETNIQDGRQQSAEAKSLAREINADVVQKVQEERQVKIPVQFTPRMKDKLLKTPMSPDRFLLTINALQQAHNSGQFAYPHGPQTQVLDAWGPSISHPRKVLSFKGKSIQQAVDRLRASNPTLDVKETNIPLEIQKLQPNLKRSLHSPRVQSTIPQPMLIRSKPPDGFKREGGATSSTPGGVSSVGPLGSRQVFKPSSLITPRVGTAAQCLRKERPRMCTALDPLRLNADYLLLTVKEEGEYREAKMKEYQACGARGVVDMGKASRAAWVRKVKGLAIDQFMKEGKVAAPELGHNVFI